MFWYYINFFPLRLLGWLMLFSFASQVSYSFLIDSSAGFAHFLRAVTIFLLRDLRALFCFSEVNGALKNSFRIQTRTEIQHKLFFCVFFLSEKYPAKGEYFPFFSELTNWRESYMDLFLSNKLLINPIYKKNILESKTSLKISEVKRFVHNANFLDNIPNRYYGGRLGIQK